MAPVKPMATEAPEAPKAPAPSKSTAQKPLATGDVTPFASHSYAADRGEHIPEQAKPAK